MKIKSFLITAVLATAILCFGTGVSAQTTDTQTLIAQLQAQIQSLLQQIAQLQAQQGTTSIPWCHTFNTNLRIGDNGTEIGDLKTALIKNGVWPYQAVTYDFDEETASYVSSFQEKYASEILAPYGLKHGTGYVGKTTRAKLNLLYGCGTTIQYSCSSGCNDVNGDGWVSPQDLLLITNLIYNTPILADRCTGGIKYDVKKDINKDGCIKENDAECISADLSANGSKQITCGTTTQPSITVTSPNGGEQWQQGSTQKITWTTTNIPTSNNMTVRLRDSAGVEHYIYSAVGDIVPNYGLFSITVPSTLIAGLYKVEVKTSVNGQSYLDSSDSYFSIVAPTTATCTDSDGGKDYFTKGTVTYTDKSAYAGGGSRTDTCSGYNDKYVREYYCDATSSLGYSYKDYECSNGCEDGVCKSSSDKASVVVVSPNGGEQFELGKYVQITWSVAPPSIVTWSGDLPTYTSYNLYATLMKGTTVIKKEKVGGLSGKGPYNLKIPLDTSYLGSDYKISLSCDSYYFCTGDESDSYFSIVSPAIAPQISSISPDAINIGETVDVLVKGYNFGDVSLLENCGISFNSSVVKINSCEETSTDPKISNIKVNVTVLSNAVVGSYNMFGFNNAGKSNYVKYNITTKTCTDSDGGLNYYSTTSMTQGLASWNNTQGTFFDTCGGSTLREYYCSDNKVYYKDYNCPGGCSYYRCNPYVRVLSPNGSESLETGKTYTIKWQSEGLTGVGIILWGPNGNQHIADSVTSSDGSNSYSWTVDSKMVSLLGGASSKYYVSVVGGCSGCNVPPQDKSDNSFTIK